MNKFIVSFCITLILSFSVLAITYDKNNIDKMTSDNTTKYSNSYKLMDYNGKLAVFEINSEVPVKIYNVFSENLPESDRIKLKEGITCKDDAELRRLIEDYTS